MGAEKQKALNSKSRGKKTRERVVLGGSPEDSEAAVDWRAVDWDWAVTLIIRIHDVDGAVMLTRSRDGGACGLRIYHDLVEAKTYYFRPDDYASCRKLGDIVDELESLAKG